MKRAYTVDRLEELLKDVFQKNGVKKATVFGSYAKGEARRGSDIDLCVETDLRGLSFISLIEDIRQVLRIDPDVVRASEVVEGSRLDREIKKDGVIIYEG
ncbi:MAG: nucleotidyltransferase domain-containing protein [Clostridia bacterium]|nr:nucleotidyltransferase domain-containing protein [Clostridia bacterium]